uniref:Evasin n=1 Tax=Rhipicephalus zambeziensis TaxID=60191 RepID=A0A224YDL4_9ACAR
MTNEDDVTDYYDYNYNETMNFDAYTPRKDVTPPSLNLSGLPWEYVADYPEPCFVQALETSFGKIAVGCAKDCLGDDTQQTQILNNCTPCIDPYIIFVLEGKQRKTLALLNTVQHFRKTVYGRLRGDELRVHGHTTIVAT